MNQNLKIRAYLIENVMDLDMKKFSDPRVLKFGIWGQKTSLGQFGDRKPLTKIKGLIKALVQNHGSNFHKQDSIFRPCFLKNHERNRIKS